MTDPISTCLVQDWTKPWETVSELQSDFVSPDQTSLWGQVDNVGIVQECTSPQETLLRRGASLMPQVVMKEREAELHLHLKMYTDICPELGSIFTKWFSALQKLSETAALVIDLEVLGW